MKKMLDVTMQVFGVMWACTGIYLIGKWTTETVEKLAYKAAGLDYDTDK